MVEAAIDILNGDMLAMQLPEHPEIKRIIFRECMMEGPLLADSFEEFLEIRAGFITRFFEVEAEEYAFKSKPELEKIEHLEDDTTVYLWFEFDVFCQFNLWYVCWRLLVNQFNGKVLWAKPDVNHFEGYASAETHYLAHLRSQAILLTSQQLQAFASLWVGISTRNKPMMGAAYAHLSDLFPPDFDVVKYAWRYKFEPDASLHPAVFAKELSALQHEKTAAELFAIFKKEYNHYGIADTQFYSFIKEYEQS